MKVIGKAQGEKLLLEATPDEVARLLGYSSEYWYKDKKRGYAIGPGDEINTDVTFHHIQHMRVVEEELLRARGIIDQVSAGLMLAHDKLHKALEAKPEPAQAQSNSSPAIF